MILKKDITDFIKQNDMKREQLFNYLKEKGFSEHGNSLKLDLNKSYIAATFNPLEILFECGTKKKIWFCVVYNSKIQKLGMEQINDLFKNCIKEYFASCKIDGVQEEIDCFKNKII